jgi:Flp pilus assembly protein TadD
MRKQVAWIAVATALLPGLPLTAQTLPADAPVAAQQETASRFSRQPEAEIRFQEGLLQYSGGRLREAEASFKAVIASDPADAEAYYHLGLAQLDQNRTSDAIESFNQSIRLDPTNDEVRAARATASIRLRRYAEAREDLARLEPDPRWRSLHAYLMGQLLYAEGDLQGAARQFAIARAAGESEAGPAQFYEGLTYLRMRELVQARRTFREAAEGVERDPTVAAASRQLDAVLTTRQRRDRPLDLQLSLGYQWDSNVIQLGSNVPLPGEISRESDGRFVLQPRASYSFVREGRFDAGVEAQGYFSFHHELDDFDIQSYQAGPFANYRLTDTLFASARYGYNYMLLGRESYLSRHLITPQLTWVQKDFGYTSVYYQLQLRDFKISPIVPQFERDGQVHGLGVVQGLKLPAIFRDAGPANMDLSYRLEYHDTDGSEFEAYFHTVGATVYTPLPWWNLRADAGATMGFDRYSNRSIIDDDARRRRDFRWGLSAGITRKINENLSIRADYTFTKNDSNVRRAAGIDGEQNFYDYDRHQLGARLILSY